MHPFIEEIEQERKWSRKFLPHSKKVPRVSNLSQSQLDNFLCKDGYGIPFIVTDATDGWPCMETWSFSWLKEKVGDHIVTTYASIDSNVHMRGALRDYIDYIVQPAEIRPNVPNGFQYINPDSGEVITTAGEDADGPQYLVAWDLEEVAPLANDFQQPYFMHGRNLLDQLYPVTKRALFNKHTWIFVGPAGSLSQLHNDHDHVHTYVAQVIGRKHFILFSPADAALLAQVDYLGHTISRTAVNPLNPDLERFPNFYKAKPYECTIEKGDLLFLPSSWLHYALGLEAGITVSKDSVDYHNFGKWFQSIAVDKLPNLMLRVSNHKSFESFPYAPAWINQLRQDCEAMNWLQRCLRS
ncbi:MAG: cupin-like domain-containing protein [Acidobacteriota bacterium]